MKPIIELDDDTRKQISNRGRMRDAAQELLEALEGLRDCIDAHDISGPKINPHMRAADAAINKARGE